MRKTNSSLSILPKELENVARIEDISALDEKVAKCYSEERYEHFQKTVKTIVLDVLGHEDGITKVKIYAREATKEYLEERGWKNRTFWIPNIIAIISVVVSIIALAVVYFKK